MRFKSFVKIIYLSNSLFATLNREINMTCCNRSGILFVFVIVSFLFLNLTVRAQSGGLVLEGEQHWETYGIGGTCISGPQNLFISDVDNDGVLEVITGGSMYYILNGELTTREAPLKIWNWNGTDIILEKSHHWEGNIRCVYCVDLDGDNVMEIITGGGVLDTTGYYSSIRIWSYDGENVVLKGSSDGVSVNSIFVRDLDNDGEPEILTTGRSSYNVESTAQLQVWGWDGSTLSLKENMEWCSSVDARANSVYAYDLNNDNDIEIITVGYDNGLENSSGQLRIWDWNGEDLLLEANEEWRMVEGCYGLNNAGGVMGNSLVENLKVGDVDGDGSVEIVSGGFTYDGEKINAQVRIWNYSEALFLEKSHEWISEDITMVKAVSLEDVDDDGHLDIVTCGFTSVYGSFKNVEANPDASQLRVWSWDGKILTLKEESVWTIEDGVAAMNVGAGDLDNDGKHEIVSVGCMTLGTLCDPDMRIWSIEGEAGASQYYPLVICGGLLAIILVGFFFFVRRRFWMSTPKSD